jgi:hypothetical protein
MFFCSLGCDLHSRRGNVESKGADWKLRAFSGASVSDLAFAMIGRSNRLGALGHRAMATAPTQHDSQFRTELLLRNKLNSAFDQRWFCTETLCIVGGLTNAITKH